MPAETAWFAAGPFRSICVGDSWDRGTGTTRPINLPAGAAID
jgi:hypothetical protein